MSVSRPFIERPIATSLLALATILGGILGYFALPISSLPQVDFPTVEVTTELPGASPETMSTLVTASLERQFGQIQSLASMSSTSSFGLSRITLQFNLDRDIDAAAQDVQAAINAAGSTLPRNLPYPPTYSKVNPADTAIVTLALTSDTQSLRSLSDLADTLLAQRLSSVSGVGHVSIEGGIKPAVRIEADVSRLASYGLSMADLSAAISAANVAGPKGSLDGDKQSYTIAANDQIAEAKAYEDVIVAYRNSAPVRLKDVATVKDGLENTRVGGWYNGKAAVIVDVQRQPGANVIDTVARIKAELPRVERSMPAGVNLQIVSDRTGTIRASVHDVQFTLVLSVGLVVMVVLLFLRSFRATIIAGVALPVSLIATFGVMYFCGFSVDNLSLMALTIGTGFVVDDAIVMIENIVRHLEKGEKPMKAALDGAREIGFTVISLTMSLIAVFIPLLFMTGLVGRMFREFALTLTIAVVVSAVVSLTLTPMMCSRLLNADGHGGGGRLGQLFGRFMDSVDPWVRALARIRAAPSAGDAVRFPWSRSSSRSGSTSSCRRASFRIRTPAPSRRSSKADRRSRLPKWTRLQGEVAAIVFARRRCLRCRLDRRASASSTRHKTSASLKIMLKPRKQAAIRTSLQIIDPAQRARSTFLAGVRPCIFQPVQDVQIIDAGRAVRATSTHWRVLTSPRSPSGRSAWPTR